MSVKADLQRRILEVIRECRQGDQYVVLVVDRHTSSIISSCCRMYDIMDAGVVSLESAHVERQKLDMSAIYFLEATAAAVDCVVKDFAGKPQYKSVHLFFTGRLPQDQLTRLAQSHAIKFIKTLKELNCDFVAFESRVFLFNRRHALRNLFLPAPAGAPNDPQRDELSRTSHHLASLCLTVNEYPYIRFQGSSKLSRQLALLVEADLNKLVSQLKSWVPNQDRERGTLLIVDRTIDTVAPLMHEYTYQAMINDLLPIEGEILKDQKPPAGAAEQKAGEQATESTDVVLSEEDPLWVEFRHRHIADVMTSVTKRFNEFRTKNAMAKLDTKNASLKDMIAAMRDQPQYQALIRQFFKHMSIAEQCMTCFEREQLQAVSELEQDLATELDNEGNKIKQQNVLKALTDLCQSPAVPRALKLRLLMIYHICQGDLGQARKKLLQAAGVDANQEQAIMNLRFLGVDFARPQVLSPERRQQFKDRKTDLALMRYVPVVQDVMKQAVADTLSRDTFPYVKEPPEKLEQAPRPQHKSEAAQFASARRKNQWHGEKKESAPAKDQSAEKGPRLIVCVLGGVTFSEIRACYEVAANQNASVFIGSSEVLTPARFIEDLTPEEQPDVDLDDDAPPAAAAAKGRGK